MSEKSLVIDLLDGIRINGKKEFEQFISELDEKQISLLSSIITKLKEIGKKFIIDIYDPVTGEESKETEYIEDLYFTVIYPKTISFDKITEDMNMLNDFLIEIDEHAEVWFVNFRYEFDKKEDKLV